MTNQPLAVRLLLGAGCLITAAAVFSAPVEADPHDDDFIDALSHAGIEYGEPGNAMAVGQSICPMLAQPGGSFAAVASGVAHRGMSPQMAQMFTTIAIQTYCPEEMANILGGNVSGLQQLPGMPDAGHDPRDLTGTQRVDRPGDIDHPRRDQGHRGEVNSLAAQHQKPGTVFGER